MPSNYKDQKPHFRWRCEAQDPLIFFFTAPFSIVTMLLSDRNFQVNERNICPVSLIILLAIFLEAYNEMRQDYLYGSERYVGGIRLAFDRAGNIWLMTVKYINGFTKSNYTLHCFREGTLQWELKMDEGTAQPGDKEKIGHVVEDHDPVAKSSMILLCMVIMWDRLYFGEPKSECGKMGCDLITDML